MPASSSSTSTHRRYLAEVLGCTLSTFKNHIHRLRGRYSALLREEVARTVINSVDVEEELRHLRVALRPS